MLSPNPKLPHFAAVLGVSAEMTPLRRLLNVSVCVRIRNRVGDDSSRRFPTPTLRDDEELLLITDTAALPGVIFPHLMRYKILASSSSRLSLSIGIEEVCLLIIVLQLDVFLTPSGSGEVEMPLLSVACLACPCAQPFAALLQILNKLLGARRTRQLPRLQLAADWSPVRFFRADQLKKQKRTVRDRLGRKGRSRQ